MADPSARTVLVVDDQSAFRVAVRRLLEHAQDFELVGEAEDAAQAVRFAEDLRPDVVLMDIKLPDASGIDATRDVLSVHPSATVILLSTYTTGDLPAAASTSGARAYLHKEDLAASVLRSLLTGSAAAATMVVTP
jgi:DNA-binding NarL/FixJ family response regulator